MVEFAPAAHGDRRCEELVCSWICSNDVKFYIGRKENMIWKLKENEKEETRRRDTTKRDPPLVSPSVSALL
jgi:hypothetical protein